MTTTQLSPLHERLRIAAGSRNYRQIGDLTNTNHETVRRYMLGHSPSAEFLAATCDALDINAQWLLVGSGPMKRGEIRTHALGEAKVSELLNAMSNTLERLMERVERLEAFVQMLEVHYRSNGGTAPEQPTRDAQWANNPPIRGIEAPNAGADHATTSPATRSKSRVAAIADAVPKRPRSASR